MDLSTCVDLLAAFTDGGATDTTLYGNSYGLYLNPDVRSAAYVTDTTGSMTTGNFIWATWYLPFLAYGGTTDAPTNTPSPSDIFRIQGGDTINSFFIDPSTATLAFCGGGVALTGAATLLISGMAATLSILY
jgi:hypothetical protein